MIQCKIEQNGFGQSLKIFLFNATDEGTTFFSLNEEGVLETNTYTVTDPDSKIKPFIEIKPSHFFPQFMQRGLLQALAEGLKDIGIVAEVDNKQRIVAEALAQERKDQNDYLKKQSENLVNKLLEKI